MSNIKLEKGFFDFLEKAIDRFQSRYPRSECADLLTVETDISFEEGKRHLDIYYLPDERKKRPVMFYIHGGGFVSGDKKYRSGVCRWYAETGLFTVSVNYGLCPESQYPQPIYDLCAALDWVEQNAEKYNLDRNKILISGDSAGAYYALLMLQLQSSPYLKRRLNLYPILRFKAGILNCGIYDVEAMLAGNTISAALRKNIFKSFSGHDAEEFKDYEYRDCCTPLLRMSRRLPPLMVIYSKKDILCPGQAEKLIEIMDAKNIYYESSFADRLFANHCYPLFWARKEAKETNAKTLDFISRVINGKMKSRNVENEISAPENTVQISAGVL